MKKMKIFAITCMMIAALGLGACNKKKNNNNNNNNDNQQPSGDNTNPGGNINPDEHQTNPDGSVTVYLNLGEIGLYEGKKGQEYPEAFLENAIKITGKPGDALPGKDKVTSTSGATFVSWMMYENSGAPVAYSVIPNYNSILLANWSGGNGTNPDQGGDQQGGGSEQQGQVTYTLNNTKGWDVFVDSAKVYSWAWGGSLGDGQWIQCSKASDTSLTFSVDASATGCKIVRFASTVTTPDWSATKWNESGDITLTGSTSTIDYAIGD